MKEKKFTYDDLYALVPAIDVHEGVKIMHVINGLQRELDEAKAEIETLKAEKLAEKPAEQTNPNALTEAQITVMRESIDHSWFPGLTVLLQNTLENDGFLHVWQLAEKTEKEMLKEKDIGPKSIFLIKGLLADYGVGLTLGMRFDRTIFTNPPATSP